MIDQTQEHSKQIELAANVLKSQSTTGLETQLKEKTDQLEDITKKYKEIEERVINQEDDLKLKLQQNLKEMAIRDQKMEFQEIQLKETRSQLDEANKQHQSMVEAMNSQ